MSSLDVVVHGIAPPARPPRWAGRKERLGELLGAKLHAGAFGRQSLPRKAMASTDPESNRGRSLAFRSIVEDTRARPAFAHLVVVLIMVSHTQQEVDWRDFYFYVLYAVWWNVNVVVLRRGWESDRTRRRICRVWIWVFQWRRCFFGACPLPAPSLFGLGYSETRKYETPGSRLVVLKRIFVRRDR